jgi:hypothetical protein
MKSIHSSVLTRALMAGAALLAIMMMDANGVRADTVIGADGAPGAFCYGDPSIDESCEINGGVGESVSAGGNPAVAIGGSGRAAGDTDYNYPSDGTGNGGNGGSATAVATGVGLLRLRQLEARADTASLLMAAAAVAPPD